VNPALKREDELLVHALIDFLNYSYDPLCNGGCQEQTGADPEKGVNIPSGCPKRATPNSNNLE
jgi:hypothetical protein